MRRSSACGTASRFAAAAVVVRGAFGADLFGVEDFGEGRFEVALFKTVPFEVEDFRAAPFGVASFRAVPFDVDLVAADPFSEASFLDVELFARAVVSITRLPFRAAGLARRAPRVFVAIRTSYSGVRRAARVGASCL